MSVKLSTKIIKKIWVSVELFTAVAFAHVRSALLQEMPVLSYSNMLTGFEALFALSSVMQLIISRSAARSFTRQIQEKRGDMMSEFDCEFLLDLLNWNVICMRA